MSFELPPVDGICTAALHNTEHSTVRKHPSMMSVYKQMSQMLHCFRLGTLEEAKVIQNLSTLAKKQLNFQQHHQFDPTVPLYPWSQFGIEVLDYINMGTTAFAAYTENPLAELADLAVKTTKSIAQNTVSSMERTKREKNSIQSRFIADSTQRLQQTNNYLSKGLNKSLETYNKRREIQSELLTSKSRRTK
jgi:hypothetical protein